MRPTGATHVDLGDLQAWFSRACPGDTLIYAIGSICADRSGFGDSLHLVAEQALRWQSNGQVFLFQRRIPRDGANAVFEYRMMRDNRSWRPPQCPLRNRTPANPA